MTERVCVFQEWIFDLSMQQQSVLVLACRGPDGVAKYHPTKEIVARYRACVLKAAWFGKAMEVDGGHSTSFMTLDQFSNNGHWGVLLRHFFDNCDSMPHHYYMHLMHGAEIIGYKHPNAFMRQRWHHFYFRCCQDLHVNPEMEDQMDNRLNDFGREHWDVPAAAE